MKGRVKLACGMTLAAIAIGVTGCGGSMLGKSAEEVEQKNAAIGISVHDPSIVKSEGNYYIFGSHMEAAESTDLVKWKSFASGVNGSNPLMMILTTLRMHLNISE